MRGRKGHRSRLRGGSSLKQACACARFGDGVTFYSCACRPPQRQAVMCAQHRMAGYVDMRNRARCKVSAPALATPLAHACVVSRLHAACCSSYTLLVPACRWSTRYLLLVYGRRDGAHGGYIHCSYLLTTLVFRAPVSVSESVTNTQYLAISMSPNVLMMQPKEAGQ